MDERNEERELVGIGGWLLFFTLSLALFSPLFSVVGLTTSLYGDPAIAEAYADVWPALQAFEWGLLAASLAFLWYLAWRLVARRTWRTVRIVIAGLWVAGPVLLVVDLAGVSTIAAVPLGSMLDRTLAWELLRSAAAAAIWTAYLLRSERVANTYPRAADADELAEVFG